jgi:streptomycin 6-kinase
MRRAVDVPEHLIRRVRAEGAECEQWLAELPDIVAELEREWAITVGNTLDGGTASLVVQATSADGSRAALKLVMPAASMFDSRDTLLSEAAYLRAAGGRGAVRLLAEDLARGALLLERAGRQLAALGLPVPAQLDAICSCLERTWSAEPDPTLMRGDVKGRGLADFAARMWEQLDRPCSARVVDLAVELATRRADEFDDADAVLVHGDAHQWNTLEGTEADGTFVLIDPDGLYAEREYDLAIPMREFQDDLLAGDALARGRERARFLADRTGTDETRIWEWGFVERVTSGLLLLHEGYGALGRDFLAVAEAWSVDA